MERAAAAAERINGWVWGPALILLILGIGLILMVRLRAYPLRRLGQGLRFALRGAEGGAGEVSSFGALCTALAATIGTGNIVGVATAICAGGPGALLWMLLAALLGMATQYAEGLLAVKYRTVDRDGHTVGGPFTYMERGMGKRWRWLAVAFAVCAVLAGLLGIGTVTQVSGITTAVQRFFEPRFQAAAGEGVRLFGRYYARSAVYAGLLVSAGAALVLVGGAQRITRVAEFLVPFMAVSYVAVNLLLLLCNAEKLPAAVMTVVRGAFRPEAVTGGAVGSMLVAAQKGISRGVFTNEAGMGTAAIAAAAARTDSPVRQGLVAMTGTFIDTVVLCTMTGLSIVLTGAWDAGAAGAAVTGLAFERGLPLPPALSEFLLMVSLTFFAFATILGWHFYAQRCLDYLTGGSRRAAAVYRWLYILAVLAGPYLSLELIWSLADITNGLMAFPNLIALYALSGVAVRETRDYRRTHEGGRRKRTQR